MINNESLIFYLEDGSSIGFIETIPEINGIYKYEPFRGLGHYTMSIQIKAGSRVKCYVKIEEKKIEFFVKGIPEYGAMQVELD